MNKKLLVVLLAFSLLTGCCITKEKSGDALITEKNGNSSQKCPEEGICQVKYLPNTSLILKRDDVNQIYYTTESNPQKSVILYEFKQNNPSEMADGNYTEEIIFEIQNSKPTLNLSDDFLSSSKLIFGKHCYCKGEAGFYEVLEGGLMLKQDDAKIEFSLNFKIGKVSHKLSSIVATVSKK